MQKTKMASKSPLDADFYGKSQSKRCQATFFYNVYHQHLINQGKTYSVLVADDYAFHVGPELLFLHPA